MTFRGKKISFWERSPLTIVELIIGITTVVGGLYVLSPFLVLGVELTGAPAVIQALASPGPLLALGLVALLNGIAMVYGVIRRNYRVRAAALFTHILIRMYTTIAVIAAQGFFPLDWLAGATVMFIAIVCYLVVRGMIIRGIRE